MGLGERETEAAGATEMAEVLGKSKPGDPDLMGCESRMGTPSHGDIELAGLKSGTEGSVFVPIDRAGKLRHWSPVYTPVRDGE